MVNNVKGQRDPDAALVYQLRIKGHLGPQWMDWFEAVTLTLEANSETLLTCPVVDQAALHGLLRRVRDLGLPLVSVTRVETERTEVADGEP